MSRADAERAIASLYQQADLRDELNDAEASALLEWGAAQIQRLAGDDASFEANLERLHTLLRQVNRFVGRQASMPPDERLARLHESLESARAIGLEPAVPAQAALDTPSPTPDYMTILQTVIGLLTPGAPASADASSPPPAERETDVPAILGAFLQTLRAGYTPPHTGDRRDHDEEDTQT